MSQAILVANNLHKSYDSVEAVRGISFSLLRGEIFSLLGPNGAGKTTIISMLSSLIKPTRGRLEVAGYHLPDQAPQVRRLIGVVPQEIALYDSLSARQNLQFWGRMYGLGGKALQGRIAQVLEQVNLIDRANDRIETYSGGMKRRINIAVGLLHEPQLLFMDEPTVGIDPQSRRRILDIVKELSCSGLTVLYTTHYMEEAEELSDRIGIIDQGRLIALGTQPELKQLVDRQATVRLHLREGYPWNGEVRLFEELGGVLYATAAKDEIVLSVADAGAALPGVVSRASAVQLPIRSIEIEEPDLEAVFLHLTGRALRD